MCNERQHSLHSSARRVFVGRLHLRTKFSTLMWLHRIVVVWNGRWVVGCVYVYIRRFFSVQLLSNCWDYKLFQLGSKRRINTHSIRIKALYTEHVWPTAKNIKHHTKQGLISFIRFHTLLSEQFSPGQLSTKTGSSTHTHSVRTIDVLKSMHSLCHLERALNISKKEHTQYTHTLIQVQNSHVILYSGDEHSSTLNRCFFEKRVCMKSGCRS